LSEVVANHSDETEYERAIQALEDVLERSRARELFCITQRDKLIALADNQQERREDAEGQDRIGAATIAKLYDTALKYDRAAAEERMRQFEAAHDRMLIANEREMAGLGRRDN
jgi:hypothetical protein